MKREYKLWPLIGVSLIAIVISILLIFLNDAVGHNPVSNLIFTFLSTLLTISTNYMIAYGLINNRMGDLKDYLHNIKYITFKTMGVFLLLELIEAVIAFFADSDNTLEFLYRMFTESSLLNGVGLLVYLLILILFLIFKIFTNYRFFVVAHRDDLTFTQLIGKIFKTGKDLTSKTIKIFMIYIFLPAVFIGLFFLPNILSTTILDVGGVPLLSLIIVIAAGIWGLIIIIKYSDIYLGYIEDESTGVKEEILPKEEKV